MILKQGSHSETVLAIQEMLTTLGFQPGGIDGIFGPNTEKAVIRFQEFAAIYADGMVGPITMAALEKEYKNHSLEMISPGVESVDGTTERLQFVRVPAHQHGKGYNRFWLREDVAEAYMAVYDQVDALGGKITSSGARRALDAHVSYNRSATSFHYLGRALDLFVWSALIDPENDPYIVQLKDRESRRMTVYVRVTSEAVNEATYDNILTRYHNKFRNLHTVKGRFINLTELFKVHGFHDISYRRRFEDDGDLMASEWWHFQYEKNLIPGVSTFGAELLRVYALEHLEDTKPWQFRERIFKQNWF